MDSPSRTQKVPAVKKGQAKRRTLLVVVIALGAIAAGWLIYENYFKPKTFEEEKQSVLEQIAKQSPITVNEEEKQSVLEGIAAQSAPAAATEEEQ